jgi:Uma2 family endonuclease
MEVAMATATSLTLEQFSALPDYDERTGCSYELDHGELIVVSPQAWEHEGLKRRVFLLLTKYFDDLAVPNLAVMETGFILDEESWRKPDVAVMSGDALRRADQDRKRPLEGAPELAIEVASPSETRAMIGRKVDHFLAAGSKTVWVLYPDTLQVQIHRVAQKSIKLGPDQFLDAPDILPGFRIEVRRFFE